MTYDAKVPTLLKREQQWFGGIIGRPIDEDSRMNPIAPSGEPMEIEAADHIAPSPTLRPAQRIQIYNQQYWWRLLNTLHDSFPMLTRLFGYYDFNKTIGIPYLVKNPPHHWSLNLLGDHLLQWLEGCYHAKDKKLVCNAAHLDWAFSHSFVAGQRPPITVEQLSNAEEREQILSQTIYLQPHIHLFQMEHHLFNFRNEFLKENPEYWLTNDFPKLERDKTYLFILYRNAKKDISWKEISLGEYHLLSFFKQGATIENACDWLEKQDDTLCEEATNNLQLWFQEWSQRGWLSLSPSLTPAL